MREWGGVGCVGGIAVGVVLRLSIDEGGAMLEFKLSWRYVGLWVWLDVGLDVLEA